MGNFGSKEDILSEIESLFKKMNNGKLTLDELEDLVSLSRELHERSVILRYKAFEEKIFGERPAVVEVPQMEVAPEVTELQEEIEAPASVIQADYQDEENDEETSDEGPAFEIEVKADDEPNFGFSLFGDEGEEKEEVSSEPSLYTESLSEEIVNEEEEDLLTEEFEDEVEISQEETASDEQEVVSESDLDLEEEIEEPISNRMEEIVQEEAPTRTMSEVERAHAENLARFFNKSQESVSYEAPKEVVTSFNTFDESPSYETTIENNHIIEKAEEKETTSLHQLEEEPVAQEEEVEVSPVYSNDSAIATSVFVHKYNQVSSELSSSQFGLVKLDSLLGSFGLNERLQFINELFDGSSEAFSNAIKHLDQQASSEAARSKVAEYAVENNWDVESDTVVEFMQKIIRRYA